MRFGSHRITIAIQWIRRMHIDVSRALPHFAKVAGELFTTHVAMERVKVGMGLPIPD